MYSNHSVTVSCSAAFTVYVCLCLCRSGWTVFWREECCTRQWLWWRIAAPSSGTWPSPWTGTISMSCLTIRWGNALVLLLLSRRNTKRQGDVASSETVLQLEACGFKPLWQQEFAVLTRPWATCYMCSMKFKIHSKLIWLFKPLGSWKVKKTDRKILFTCVFRYKTK